MKPKEKGDILENAVEKIERLIIDNTALKNSYETQIIRNMRFYKEKVLIHEIDLYISIDFGFGNKHTYILECKNWDCKSISKTQVLDFQTKIRDTGAAKGFFIAKSFSPAAQVLANEDNYLELLKFSKSELSDLINAPALGKFVYDSDQVEINKIRLDTHNSIGKISFPAEKFLNETIRFNNNPVNMKVWIMDIINKNVQRYRDNNRDRVGEAEIGQITLKDSLEIDFEEGQFLFQNESISKCVFDYQRKADVYQTKIISKFDIEKKGRNIHYELIHPTKKGMGDFTTIQNLKDKRMWDISFKYRLD